MSIPVLETSRLRIQEYTAGDLENRRQLMAQAFGNSGSLEATHRWLEWTIASYRELARLYQPPYGDYAITLKSSGELIGAVGLVPALIPWNTLLDETPPAQYLTAPEFGLFWAIFQAHQGQGYATEAGRALIEFIFAALHARRVVATTEHEKLASQRVMRKLGMRLLRNEGREPGWCQVVGVLEHPAAGA